jgi:hypothetical protein
MEVGQAQIGAVAPKDKKLINLKVSYAVFSLVFVSVVGHTSFRLVLLLLARFVCAVS